MEKGNKLVNSIEEYQKSVSRANKTEVIVREKEKVESHNETKDLMYQMLLTDAKAQKAKALLTLKGFETSTSFIGDHSTEDLYNNLKESLKNLSEANELIELVNLIQSGKY